MEYDVLHIMSEFKGGKSSLVSEHSHRKFFFVKMILPKKEGCAQFGHGYPKKNKMGDPSSISKKV